MISDQLLEKNDGFSVTTLMLSQSPEERTFRSNFLLASVTAFTAGMTNMSGLMAC